MSNQKQGPRSELSAAAEALAEELESFEGHAHTFAKEPFDSQKSLERAAKTLKAVTECDERLSARAKALVEVIGAMRQRQQEQAAAISERARLLEGRAGTFQRLMERYQELGLEAGRLNERVQAAVALAKEGNGKAAEVSAALGEAIEAMGAAANSAEALQKDAGESDFGDIERQADSLRQQLLSAKNKLSLVQGKVAPPPN